jgi:hypothetical protein
MCRDRWAVVVDGRQALDLRMNARTLSAQMTLDATHARAGTSTVKWSIDQC